MKLILWDCENCGYYLMEEKDSKKKKMLKCSNPSCRREYVPVKSEWPGQKKYVLIKDGILDDQHKIIIPTSWTVRKRSVEIDHEKFIRWQEGVQNDDQEIIKEAAQARAFISIGFPVVYKNRSGIRRQVIIRDGMPVVLYRRVNASKTSSQ